MGKRYIDADKLLKNWCESICKPKPNCSDDCFAYSEITNAPTADVRENVKGEWINKNKGIWNTLPVYQCSVCGDYDTRYQDTDNFCPNCGADMRGKENG